MPTSVPSSLVSGPPESPWQASLPPARLPAQSIPSMITFPEVSEYTSLHSSLET
eukprot:CAMPEP_0119305604 /NCGR_PEP_ID=MMETSP1333-20130426/6568_1 /TAXON_ID=418940 /ORGANISM="Scyphosphaera apsteinii, Strain RCC1455" /LENGTH=53 /DNA_ID=CAMNT_0007308737 /DNA_START=23 /DNA_END=180 /DNA_ORIENTATION=-